jgi:hypothetical protein
VNELFPRTVVGGVSLPRMIIGTNWLLGYSHRGPADDNLIKEKYSTKESFLPVFKAFLDNGIDAVMAPLAGNDLFVDGINYAEQKLGKKIIRIDTPIINVDDSDEARKEAEQKIRDSKKAGSTFCLIHHYSTEQLVCKNTRTINRFPDYLNMIRENGMLPGCTAHMPEIIDFCDSNGYDVETYIQIFNCMGFMMQMEIESVVKTIHAAKKPVITIKPMAAGRTTAYVGLTFNYSVLRACDMVTVGCYSAEEVNEDIEISRAALEHRLPDIEKRNSPAPKQALR